MPRRSQEHMKRYGRLDAEGNAGYQIRVATGVPVEYAHPGGGSIAVNVVDANGVPVEGLVLSTVTSDAGVLAVTNATSTTDASGDASIAVTTVAAGSAYVVVSAPGLRPYNLPVTVT